MPPQNIESFIQSISFLVLNPIISILFGAAFIVFLWGIIEYFWQSESEEARTRGGKHVTWGLIGMFVMFAAFVIVRIIATTIGSDLPVGNFAPY